MAITTLDGALAGMKVPQFYYKQNVPAPVAVGKPVSYWYTAGIPGAGAADTSTAYGVARSSSSSLVNGQIPYYDPGGGSNTYLAKFIGYASQPGVLMLCDRIWDCGAQSSGTAISITSTSSQTINSNTSGASNNGGSWYARDNNGSSNGEGVLIAVEVSSATGSGTPTMTMTYTNSAGTGSHTGAYVTSTVASSPVGQFYPITLQAGDTGVRSVQTIQHSATWSSGQYILVAYRVLAQVEIDVANTAMAVDCLTSGFVQLYNGTVPFLVYVPSSTTGAYVAGQMIVTQG